MYCRLNSFERHYYAEHLKRLDEGDRFLRFSFLVKDEWIDRFVDNLDFNNHVIKVIYENGIVVGAVHIALCGGQTAEIGVSVEKAYRGRRWGHLLFNIAIEWCKNNGITKIEAMCLNSNKWVIKKMQQYNSTFERDGSQTIAHAEIKEPVTLLDRYIHTCKEGWEQIYWYTNKSTQFLRTALQHRYATFG